MKTIISFGLAAICGVCALYAAPFQAAGVYDLVIANGRVIDPESGLDGVRHIGIISGVVRAVASERLEGRAAIDASGLVVAPGFIDLHQHAQRAVNPAVDGLKAMDGVTTALELEVGTDDIDRWYAAREGKSIVNYGASIGHIPSRIAVMNDAGDFLPSGPAAHRAATAGEIADVAARIEHGLERGAPAVGFGFAYTPAADRVELVEAFKAAARAGASVHVHVRGGGDPVASANEAIALAEETGAALHIVHVQSSGGAQTGRVLSTIAAARARGLDVTTEMYPYTAGQTRIESALFDDWETYPDDRFHSYLWPATGERLTRESFAKYRKAGGSIIMFSNTEETVRGAAVDPQTMIASDGGQTPTHPRTAGTFSKILGVYVRDAHALTLTDALRKMTIMPAQRLERRVPGMKRKGRIQPGADADVIVFDPARVADRSTYEKPAVASIGMVHVLVNGVPVVRDGRLVDGVAPGRAVRAPIGGAETIQGRWKLIAAEDLRANGSVARYPWGGRPVGSIVVEGGSCYLQIMSSDVPSFGSGAQPAGEQMKAALLSSYIAYSGPCTIDEAAGSVTLRVEAAWRPDYVGTEQKRFFRFDNGRLIFAPAPNSVRGAGEALTRRLTLERP
jgi:N-acyl-D-aspartate/D-glutamate deacylase